MHVLYVHKNFPAQFRHIAKQLINRHGFRCSVVTERTDRDPGRVHLIPYKIRGGATKTTHFAGRKSPA